MSASASSSNEITKSKFGRLSVNYFPLCRIQQAMNHQIKTVQQSSTSVMDAIHSSDSEDNDRDTLDEDDEESVFDYSGNVSWSSDEVPDSNVIHFDVDVQGVSKFISSTAPSEQIDVTNEVDNANQPLTGSPGAVPRSSMRSQRRRHRRHHRHRGCSHHGIGMCVPYQCEVLKFRQGPVTTPLPASTVKRLNSPLTYDNSVSKKDVSLEESEKGEIHVSEKHPPQNPLVSVVKHALEDHSVKPSPGGVAAELPGYGFGPNVPVCRFCHMPGEVNKPLINPCRCRGTLQYIHQDCLLTWLSISKTKKRHYSPVCELCNYTYRRRRTFQLLQCRFPEVSRQDRVYHLICVFSFLLMLMGAMATLLCFFADRNRTNLVARPQTEASIPTRESTHPNSIDLHSGSSHPNNKDTSSWHSNVSHSTIAPTLPLPLFLSTSKDTNALTKGVIHDDRIILMGSGLSLEEVVTLVSGIVFFLAFFVAMIVQIKSRHTLYQLCLRFVQSSSSWRILPYDPANDKDGSLISCPPYHYLHTAANITVTSQRIAPFHSTQSLSAYADSVSIKMEAPEQVSLLNHSPVAAVPQSLESHSLDVHTKPPCSMVTCNEEVVLILPPGVTINTQDMLLSSTVSDVVHFNILSTSDEPANSDSFQATDKAVV